MKNRQVVLLWLVVLALCVPNVSFAAVPDKTTKYRVYQSDMLLQEFSNLNQATNFAKQWTNSHVEQIGTRAWLWDNFPRYKVYQYDNSSTSWEFATLEAAIAEAKKWGHASVRDLRGTGWVWHNYATNYRLYQGDITLSEWEFATLKDATLEGQKWSNAHIIDLSNNHWVWDNIPTATKNQLRTGVKTYQVYQGTYTQEDWKFAYLEDAVREALNWSNSYVINLADHKTAYHNTSPYQVYQNDNLLNDFISLDHAIAYAKRWSHATIKFNQREIWNNYPYYQVYQHDNLIQEFNSIPQALEYAQQYSHASIRTYHQVKFWDNFRNLQYWAWNGSSAAETIKSQVSGTQGLDVDSPSWFQLADAEGNLTDSSNKDTVAWLKNAGHQVHPLVSNQFNSTLTTQFLSNVNAQQKFIQSLVQRASELGVDGINIDFESINGKDRQAFTAFVERFTTAAHEKRLIVSIDLPRGSVKWNHLTAFDHEKLATIVDYIITMTYDHHYSGSPTAGSVAGLQWTEEGITEFLSYGIPRDKLIMGIPYYVRAWRIDSEGKLVDNRAVLMKNIPSILKEKNATLTWDNRFNQYKAQYQEDGYTHVFWIEDEETMKARLEIAQKYELAGVAAWRLGYEQADLWKMMIQQK